GGAFRMERIHSCSTTNRRRKIKFFRAREWWLRIPNTILKDLWFFGEFIENSTNRVGSNQRSIRGGSIGTSELDLHAIDAIKPICRQARQQICNAGRPPYPSDSSNACFDSLIMQLHHLASH